MMRSEKSSVAWFKLAEFVARREKERAITVYRLLAHALSDEAYSLQLGGDLMRAFDDTVRARALYYEAAKQYEVSMRYFQAGYMYEKILTEQEDADSFQLWLKMIICFDYVDLEYKITQHAARAVAAVCNAHRDPQKAWHVIQEMAFSSSCTHLLHTFFTVHLAELQAHRSTGSSRIMPELMHDLRDTIVHHEQG